MTIVMKAVLLSAFLLPTVLMAQAATSQITVAIRNDTTPIAGALVAIVAADGKVVDEAMTSVSGIRVLAAPAGTYRVRVRRVGYRPFFSDQFALPGRRNLIVQVDDIPVALAAVVVSARPTCRSVASERDSLSLVWGEVEKSLQLSQLTIRDLANIGQSKVYTSRTDRSGKVVSLDSNFVHLRNQKPFGSPDPDTLASAGYVRGSAMTGWEYFGPDERVLMSPSFRSTHCFTLTRKSERPGEIGVAFEPVAGRRISDIRGVIWLDQESAFLKEIVFTYLNADPLTRFRAGGFTRFSRLASGSIAISEWQLSAPILEVQQRRNQQLMSAGTQATGGVILNLQPGSPVSSGSLPNQPSASLTPPRSGAPSPQPISKSPQRAEDQIDVSSMTASTVVADSIPPAKTSRNRPVRRGGRFINRHEIATWNKSSVLQLVGAIPGVQVRSVGGGYAVQMRRCGSFALPGQKQPEVAIYLDGLPLREGLGRLGQISSSDIEAIEVFSGTVELPPEARGNGCGAIFVWLSDRIR